ncbi:hypothetical protein BH24GEM2_BH24GEM2_07700 [soil metagenome]
MRPNVRWRLLGVLFLAASAFLLWPYVSAFLAVDTCLDSGGSYNYVTSTCDFHQSHPSRSFYESVTFWAGIVLGLLGLWAIARRSVAHAP